MQPKVSRHTNLPPPEEMHKQLPMLSSSLVLGLLHFISLLTVIT